MRRVYTQMREMGIEYPLDTYNKLSKPQQVIFTFLMKYRNNDNTQRILNIEIAECLKMHAQHVSTNLKAIIHLNMIRRGTHNLIMINPNMWFFGESRDQYKAVEMWDSLN